MSIQYLVFGIQSLELEKIMAKEKIDEIGIGIASNINRKYAARTKSMYRNRKPTITAHSSQISIWKWFGLHVHQSYVFNSFGPFFGWHSAPTNIMQAKKKKKENKTKKKIQSVS